MNEPKTELPNIEVYLAKDPQFSYYESFKEIGRGDNGCVYKAKHSLLNKWVVIKVYCRELCGLSSDDDKFVNEIRKNASFRLSVDQPVIFGTGLFQWNGYSLRYSIMEFLDAFTLSDWVDRRSECCGKISNDDMEVIQTNAALGFLYACLNLFEHEYSHGDLNPNNIMFLEQEENERISPSLVKEANVFYKYSTHSETHLIPTHIEFIDYGTSQIEDTSDDEGYQREVKKIISSLELILKGKRKDYSIHSALKYLKFDVTNPLSMVGPIADLADENLNNEAKRKALFGARKKLIEALIRIVLILDFSKQMKNILGGYRAKEGRLYVEKLLNDSFADGDRFEFLESVGSYFRELSYYQKLHRRDAKDFIDAAGLLKLYDDASLPSIIDSED